TSTHAGAHQFKVKVSDGSLTSEVDAALVVNLPMTPVDPDLVNHAPTITPLPTIKAVAGKVAIVDVTASDKDGDSLTYSLLNNPSWVSINGKTITINPTSVHTGNHQFKVRVSDGSLTSEVDAVLVVNLPMTPVDPDLVNHAPIFITESIPSFNYEHGSMIDEKTFQVIAKDQDGDALMFSLEGAPPFISISKSGLLSVSPFRPDHVSDTLRVFYVVVSDGVLSVKIKAEIFVNYNSSPTIDSSDCVFDVINVNESIPVTASICTLKGSDPDGDAFQFVLQRGGNWASITQVTGTLTLMPTVKDIGKHELIVGTIDEYGATSTASIIPVTVTGNYGPDIEQIAPQKVIAEEREPLISHEWRVQASDPENDIIEYSLMDAPRWLSINKNGILSAMPAPSDKGLYSYKVKVKDAKGAFNIETGQVTVEANFKPVVQPIEDILTEVTKTQEFNVVQAEDPEGRSLTYMLVNAPAWASISNGIDDKGQLTFRTKEQDIGLYELTLRVSDGVLSTDDNIKVLVTPPMPENIKVSSHGRKRLVLSWDESIQDVYYKLYRNDEFLANSDKTSYLDVNVNDDAEYKYGISACKNEFCSKTAEISAINEGSDSIFINTVNYDAGLYNSFTTRLHYFDSNDKWVGYNYFIKDSGKIEFGDTYGDGKYRVDVTQQPKNGQVCTSNRGGKDYFSNGQDIEVAIDCTTPGQLTFNNDTIEISRYAKGVLGAKPSLFRISDNVEMQFSQIKFRSSNDDIVTVDQNTGAITSKGAIGEAIITAYFDSNFYGENVSASYRVNVVESNVHYAIEHVDLGQNVLTKPSQSIGITSGRDFLLRAFVYALDASNTTKPELLVKLSSNGKEVTLPLKCPEQLSTEKPVMPNYSLDGACYLKISDLSILDKDSSKMEIILLDNNTLSEYKYEVGVNLPYILRMKVIRIGYKGLIADYISPELLEKRIRRIMPFQGVQISYNHEPLDISDEASVSVFNVLRRVEQYRREFGEPGVTYIGVSPGGCSGGVAYLPGRTVVFQYRKTGCYNNVDSTIISFPHEVGHSLSIPHTVCNAEATVDKTWLNESLLWPGSKEGKNSTVPLLDMDENKIIDPNSNYPITTYDIMGYCGGEFLSEYNINNILRYLKGTTDYLPNKKSKLLTEVKKEKVLMISGLFDEGNVYLNKPKITQGTLYKNKGEYTVFVTTHNNQVIEADFEALNISHSDAKDFFINIPYIEGVKDMIFVDNKNNIYPVKDISEHQEK
ncbi:hypothetical protein QNE60_005002, partial [Vibrio harveyi]|nr:hypothetical protein [Vibrio harveyi]